MHKLTVAKPSIHPAALHWEALPANWVKVNWDVAIKANCNKIGIGVVIRDCDGVVLASLMKPMLFCVEPSLAKARDLLAATLICKELGLHSLFFF